MSTANSAYTRLRPIIKEFPIGHTYASMEVHPEGLYVSIKNILVIEKERDRLKAEVEHLKNIIKAVKVSEWDGILCENINGVNWFDAVSKALEVKDETVRLLGRMRCNRNGRIRRYRYKRSNKINR